MWQEWSLLSKVNSLCNMQKGCTQVWTITLPMVLVGGRFLWSLAFVLILQYGCLHNACACSVLFLGARSTGSWVLHRIVYPNGWVHKVIWISRYFPNYCSDIANIVCGTEGEALECDKLEGLGSVYSSASFLPFDLGSVVFLPCRMGAEEFFISIVPAVICLLSYLLQSKQLRWQTHMASSS